MTIPIDSSLAPRTAEDSSAKKAADQLEAFFIRRMLAEMRKSVGSSMLSGGYSGKMFQDMLDEAMADQISESGGLGISSLMAADLEGPPPAAQTARLTVGAYAPAGNDLRHVPVQGRLSSDFGKRVHPVTGAHSFHEGLDVAAATGTEVGVAGAGVVVRAEKAGNYGNIVVVDHGGGLETRYAHLDEIGVQVGQQMAPGEVVGTVGATGRVTGAHLHFEVRRGGKAIDPKGEMRNFENELINAQDLAKAVDR